MRVIDGEPIRLKPHEGGGLPIPFETGITGTKELMDPSVEHYLKTRKKCPNAPLIDIVENTLMDGSQ